MKVTQVSATIRFSKGVHEGWKSVELGAEASLEPGDDCHQAQQCLYASLTAQLRTLWGGEKNGVAEHVPGGSRIAVQPSVEGTQPVCDTPGEHYCRDHGTQFRRFEREGQVWYSHKCDDGRWCREK